MVQGPLSHPQLQETPESSVGQTAEKVLALLADEGAVDPALWSPPCNNRDSMRLHCTNLALRRAFRNVLDVFLSHAAAPKRQVGSGVRTTTFVGKLLLSSTVPTVQNKGRFMDGLLDPGTAPQSEFYALDYRPAKGVLSFCVGLPNNDVDLDFDEDEIAEMCTDAVMKVCERGRQQDPLSPLHILPIYVYSYELSDGDDQIYAAMNAAMRNNDNVAIGFWRPFIWHLDQALLALPPYEGKLYRGIDVRVTAQSYRPGGEVCWQAFSSATTERAVADEFVKEVESAWDLCGIWSGRTSGGNRVECGFTDIWSTDRVETRWSRFVRSPISLCD